MSSQAHRTANRVDPLRERLLGAELASARSVLDAAGWDGVVATAKQCLREVQMARTRFDALVQALERATLAAQAGVVERYLRETAGDAATLTRDLRALARGEPDVLDVAALGERFARQSDAAECRAEACLALARSASEHLESRWVETLLELALAPGRWSRRTEAIRWLAAVDVSATGSDIRARVQATLAELTSPREQRWVQWAALASLAAVDEPAAHAIARDRLLHPGIADDFLVRASIVSLVGLWKRKRWLDLLDLAHEDTSEHVRITAARVQASNATLQRIARLDPSHRVRASALIRLAHRHVASAAGALCEALRKDSHGFVVQTAAEELARLARRGRIGTDPALARALADAAERADLPAPARNACRDARVELHALHDVSAELLSELRAAVQSTPVGGSTEVASARLRALSEASLGRMLAVVARDDFGVGVDRSGDKIQVHRGERRAFSLWRALFELMHPAPDKRQGFSHVVAQRLPGALRSPSGGLAEATATRVPGQRVVAQNRGDWGRELPSVEDLLAQRVVRATATRIASAVGIATISPPASFAQRVKGVCSLLRHYARFAALRQHALESNDPQVRASYARDVLRETGTSFEVVPYALDWAAATPEEPASLGGTACLALAPVVSVPSSAPLRSLRAAWDVFRDVSIPASDVGLAHLAGFSVLLLGALVTRQAFIRRRISVERHAIPLVIGGWGTRGKSGSERLKAALFQGLGYECLVKTTGCEAMFIHAIPGLPAREVFIYRPYDKPTIWEQRSVLALAARLRVRVFLWECMALQPELVNLLQLQWMHDDISTITNAYPDHEDVQGPTGFDVADTISEFVPREATAFTTEVQMLPLLKTRGVARGTRVVAVPPREVELISDDLRARFGHDEHPANIALVAALARRSGVPGTVAIAEMADHVVADLGALKTFPTVQWRGRRLSFTNGMGANDRAATLENWRRSGFHAGATAEGWVVTVVNNRADRPARTRVFADLLVKDISGDCHVLIGTNLSGMQRELRRALDEEVYALSPTRDLPDDPSLREEVVAHRLTTAFARLLVDGVDAASVAREASRKNVRLPSLSLVERLLVPAEAESYQTAKLLVEQGLVGACERELVPFLVSIIARRRVVRALRVAATRSLGAGSTLDSAFATAYREIFLEQVVCAPDPAISGDSIVDLLASRLPMGAAARVMGLQNIKGTGLDFVYRWVSIETVQRICMQLHSGEPSDRQRALDALMVHDDYGVVDATFARDAVERARARDGGSGLRYDPVHHKLGAIVSKREARLGTQWQAGWLERSREIAGATLDFVDAVRRRGMAARVLDALAAGRISHATAAVKMRRVLARSKGAWLTKRQS